MDMTEFIDDSVARKKAHDEAAEQWFGNIANIKDHMRQGRLKEAAEEWYSLPQSVQTALWISPRAGGCWTTIEREKMKLLFPRFAPKYEGYKP